MENVDMKNGELFDIQTLENDTTVQKKIWWGGVDSKGKYHRGAREVGTQGWAESVDGLLVELNRLRARDLEEGVTREYAYSSGAPEPVEDDQPLRRGVVLVALDPQPLQTE